MSSPWIKTLLIGSIGGFFLLCCALPVGLIGCSAVQASRQDPDIGRVEVTNGTVEVVVPRDRQPGNVSVSPTGQWLLFSTNNEAWFVMNIDTGEETRLEFPAGSDLRWLNDEEFAAGYWIVNAQDLSILKLEVSWFDMHEGNISAIESLRGAQRVYLLPDRHTGGVDLVSGDPAFPYGFDAFGPKVSQLSAGMTDTDYTYQLLQEKFPETDFVMIERGYFQPTPGYRGLYPDLPSADYYVNYDFPSLDGRFYAKGKNEPGVNGGRGIEIYQCGQKIVAHTAKRGWHMYPKGWAYDNSGFYFVLEPRVGWFSAGEQPISILKLNLSPEVLAEAPPYQGEGFCE